MKNYKYALLAYGTLTAFMPGVCWADIDADLRQTTEIQFGSAEDCQQPSQGDACALRQSAVELESATRMYEFVRNNVEFSLYQGSRSNSVNTLFGLRASDVDTASVLIALLRSHNIPARYAVGTVRAESEKVTRWLGVRNLDLAVSILRDQGIQKVSLSADRATVDFEHVWVEALVSYANYRAAGRDEVAVNCAANRAQCRWISLAPAFKFREVNIQAIDPYPAVNFDYTRYYNAIKNNDAAYKDKNPLEIYEEQVLEYLRVNYPGKSLEDIREFGRIIPEELGVLPNSLPFQVMGSIRRYNSVTDHDLAAAGSGPVEAKPWAKLVKIYVTKQAKTAQGSPTRGSLVLFDGERTSIGDQALINNYGWISVRLAALTTTRLTLSFRPCPEGQSCITSELRFGEYTLSSKKPTAAVDPAKSLKYRDPLFIEVWADGAPAPDTTGTDTPIYKGYANSVVGGYYLFGTGGDTFNWSQVHRASAELLAANDRYPVLNDANGAPHVDTNDNGVLDAGEPRLLDHPDAMDALTGGLLFTAMNLYGTRLYDAARRLDALNHVVSLTDGLVGMVSSVDEVEYVDGTAFSVMPGGLLIDVAERSNGRWRTNDAELYASKQGELYGHTGSSLEHEIWQEITGYDAISTVRGIQLALAAGAPLLNAKKNSTTDTVPASYAGFGFASGAPSPFQLQERDIFSFASASWVLSPDPGTNQSFETFKATISASDDSLRRMGMIYRSGDLFDTFMSRTDEHETWLAKARQAGYGGAPTTKDFYALQPDCASSTTIRHSGTINDVYYKLLDHFNETVSRCFNRELNSGSYFDRFFYSYFNKNKGFVPSEQVYRSFPAQPDLHPAYFVHWLRNTVYLTTSCTSVVDGTQKPCWREFVLAGKLTTGPNYRFSVYIDKWHIGTNESDSWLGGQTYAIQNKTIRAGGGYVDGNQVLQEHTDTTGTVFNNEVFTDQNLNLLVNNDLIKTPSTTDPVSTVTGNMYHDETDLMLKGRGLNYSFTRTYNSGPGTEEGPLGPGWTHSYNMRLVSNDYGRYPNYPSMQPPEGGNYAPENDNDKTSSITYVDERGGEVNYLVNDLNGTYAVTLPRGVFDALALNSPVPGQYTLTFRNGVDYIFEGGDLKIPGNTARLLRIQDPYGNQLNFAYDSSNRLSSVSDNLDIAGRAGLSFSYEIFSGKLNSVTDWAGRTWDYDYDDGKLVSVTNPRNEMTTYSYHPDGHLLKEITHPADRGGQRAATIFRYYRNSKAFDYTNKLGQAETLDYDLYRKRTQVTDPRGFVREYHYDKDGALTKLSEPDGAILLFDNNADGLRYSKIDGLGHRTTYSYRTDRSFSPSASDTFGKVTREEDPLGNTMIYEYDLFDQIRKVTDKNGKVWSRVHYTTTDAATGAVRGKAHKIYSPLSSTVPTHEYSYYPNGNVHQRIERIDLANPLRKRITNYAYDAEGLNLLERVVSGSGQTIRTSFTYDSLGRKKTQTLYRRTNATDSTISPLTNTYDYDDLDRLVKVTDPLGNVAETVYDANGKVTEEKVHYKRLDGSFDTRVYARHHYDIADRRVKTTDITGSSTTLAYDAAGDLIASTDANGHTTRYERDAMGRPTGIINANGYRTEMEYDLGGRLVRTVDANGNATKYEYDALGRKTKVVSAVGSETRLSYDANGNLKALTDANAVAGIQPKNVYGASVYNEYDGMGRLTRTVDAKNGDTNYSYDLLGNVLTITDAENRVTAMVYDNLGRLIQVVDPFSEDPVDKVVTLSYDEAGNLLTYTDRKDQTTRHTYDALNRLVRTEYLADGTQETRAYNLYGNLERIGNGVVTYVYEYDVKNRLTRKTDTRLNKFLAWTYDPVGNIRTKTDYQGEVTTYQYDSTNRLVAETNPGYVQVSYHYDPAGRLLDRILSNGAKAQYSYDAENRLVALNSFSANGAVIYSQDYSYDRARNITGVAGTNGSISYGYDPVYRLTAVDVSGDDARDQTYTYDKVGNRKRRVSAGIVSTYQYDAGNRLTSVSEKGVAGEFVTNYFYDENGSRIETRGEGGAIIQSYAYDQKRQIIRLTTGTGTNYFQYDPAGYRTQKTDSSGTHKYLLEAEHLEATYDQSNQLVDKYLRGAVIDEIVYGYRAENGRHVPATYHHDHLQSVVALTSHEGSVQETLRYDAFGSLQSQSGSSTNDLNYTGRERDRDTGLYYYRARYYDPEVGRFLTEDPLGFKGGINFYAYVNNNPINANDPTGQLAVFWHWLISYDAARDAGYGVIDSASFATDVMMADRGTQGLDPSQTMIHGMSGLIAPGVFQTPEVAITNAEHGIFINMGNDNYAYAAHTGQDLAADWHAGQEWHGGLFENLFEGNFEYAGEALAHYYHDVVPGFDIIGEAYDNTMQILGASSDSVVQSESSDSSEEQSDGAPGGGYVLYPNKPNTNLTEDVYSKEN